MNVLPLIFSFLIVLALIASTLMRETASTRQISRAVFCRLQAEANVRTLKARAQMQKIKPKPESSQENQTNDKQKETTTSQDDQEEVVAQGKYFRNLKSPFPGRQMSLSSLFSNPNKSNLTYEAALKLLKILYADLPFWKEAKIADLSEQILKALIENKDKPLHELIGKKGGLGEIFYKILKGTNTYDVQNRIGIPPLLDFFSFDEQGTRCVYFPRASKPLLTAMLGAPVADRIEEKERAKGEPLTKNELTDLVRLSPEFFALSEIDTIFYFHMTNETETISAVHETTGISYR